LIGGYVVTTIGWRWTQWIVAIFAVVVSVITSFMQETHKPTILRRQLKEERRLEKRHRGRHERLQEAEPDPSTAQDDHSAIFREFITKVLFRPVHMACVEPVVGFFTLYISINFGMVYGTSGYCSRRSSVLMLSSSAVSWKSGLC
jgi:MFS family permease